MGVGQILVDFCGWTSCHGVPHVGAASNWCLRAFWLGILIVCACMFGWQFSMLYTKYTSYPVAVTTSLNFQPLTFPAVLVCNVNPYKKSILTSDPNIGMDTSGNGLLFNFNQAMEGNSTATDPKFGFQGMNDTLALQAKAKDNLVYLMATSPLTSQASFNLTDTVANCAYNTSACNLATTNGDFTIKPDPVYGNCFEFNSNSIYGSNRAGPLYGLRVLLKSNQADYLPMMESAGARIAIHSQSTVAFPDAFGFNAAVGFTTSFAIQYVTTSRLSSPYGVCASSKSGYTYGYSNDYTVEGCFRSCFQQKAYQTCKCGDPRFTLNVSGTTIPACRLNTTCLTDLSNPTVSGFNPIVNCSCPQPCFEATYTVTASNALWPAASFMPQECESTQSKPNFWSNQTECVWWYSNNTLLVEVYFERMNFQSVTESPAYPLVSVVSDLGGQLGLWMGLSVITLIEFFSLLILLVIYGVRVGMKKPQFAGKPVGRVDAKPPPYEPYDKTGEIANTVVPRPN